MKFGRSFVRSVSIFLFWIAWTYFDCTSRGNIQGGLWILQSSYYVWGVITYLCSITNQYVSTCVNTVGSHMSVATQSKVVQYYLFLLLYHHLELTSGHTCKITYCTAIQCVLASMLKAFINFHKKKNHPILSHSSHCCTISKLSCHVSPAVWIT